MFGNKLFRYKEFSIPFVVYRAGELSREDFLQLIRELKEIQDEQHEALLAQLDDDEYFLEKHERMSIALEDVIRHFDEAIEIAEQALIGPLDEEDDLLEDSLATFRKGNIILADTFYDLDEAWERSGADGLL